MASDRNLIPFQKGDAITIGITLLFKTTFQKLPVFLMSTFTKLALFGLLLVLVASCAPSRELAEEAEAPVAEEEEMAVSTLLTPGELSELRLNASARFNTGQNPIPEVYRLTDEDVRDVDTNAGFRIQLLSTESVALADSMSLEYYDWAGEFDAIPFDVLPEAYVTYRQPFYRVRIGDFQRRSDANTYLAILREQFPGAWVVMDTIDPELAP